MEKQRELFNSGGNHVARFWQACVMPHKPNMAGGRAGKITNLIPIRPGGIVQRHA
jgi:hypothetical protein